MSWLTLGLCVRDFRGLGMGIDDLIVMCACVCVSVYIYIYIYLSLSLSLMQSVYTCFFSPSGGLGD